MGSLKPFINYKEDNELVDKNGLLIYNAFKI